MATIDNSPEARLARLQAKWQWTWTVAQNLQKSVNAQETNPAPTTWAWAIVPTPTEPTFTYVNNPDGTPVDTSVPPKTNVPTTTPTPTQFTPTATNVRQTSWMQTTWASVDTNDATSQNISDMQSVIKSTENATVAENKSQQNLTNELNAIDTAQLETKKKDAEANQAEFKAIQEQQIAEKAKNEMDYQAELQRQQSEDTAALKTLQEGEYSQNQAILAETKAKNDADEHEMKIQNELALERNWILFSKLWLSFSGAAINTATQIYNTGMYNFTKLKTWNAKDYADLQMKMNTTAFNHKQAINKIISDNSENMMKSKERLREFIGSAQNNILNNKAQTQKSIQDAIDKFKSEKQTREDKMWSDMNKANDRLLASTKEYQKTIDFTNETNKKKIDSLVTNGQWNSLSPQQRVELEKAAWLPAWTTQNTIVAKTTQMITDWLKAIIWKAVGVPPATLNKMHLEVQRMLKLNVPMNTAVQMAIEKYKNTIPQVKQIEDAAKAKSTLDAEKLKMDLALKQSQITKNQAAAAKSLRPSGWGSSRSSWGSGWTKATKLQSKYFDIEEETGWTSLNILWKTISIPWQKKKKSVQWSYNPVTWDYTYEGKKVTPLKSWNASSTSSSSNVLSLNNPY